MLDIKLFRENPELIFDSEKKRFRGTETAEKVIEYDTLWREGEKRLNFLRSEKNRLSKSFKKANESLDAVEKALQTKEGRKELKKFVDVTTLTITNPAKIKVNTKRVSANNSETETNETDEILVIEKQIEDYQSQKLVA